MKILRSSWLWIVDASIIVLTMIFFLYKGLTADTVASKVGWITVEVSLAFPALWLVRQFDREHNKKEQR